MTLKELLESYDEPLNESLFDKKKLEAVGKKIKEGAKFIVKLGAIYIALNALAGTNIMSWDRDALKRNIEDAKWELKTAKQNYLSLSGGIEDGKIYPDIYPEVRKKLKNQIIATSDVIDNAETVLNKEGKLLKAANPFSDKSLKAVNNELKKVMTSAKITDRVIREVDKEIENNDSVYKAKVWKDYPEEAKKIFNRR